MTYSNPLADRISEAFAPVPARDGGLLVPTSLLYPSNGNVVVYVSGGHESCVVSDRGDALRNARAHCVEIPDVNAWLSNSLRGSFLHHARGQITSGAIRLDEIVAGIALVSRAASDAVRYALDHYKRPGVTVYKRTYETLIKHFGTPNVSREMIIAGASNRNYRFDFSIPVSGSKRLFLDTVSPNPNSVNATAIAHIDVGNLKERAPFHAIVFDPESDWEASDINLLQSASQLLPIARLSNELGRYESLH